MACETIFWNKSNLLDGSFGTILQEAVRDNAGVPLYFSELLYIMGAFLKNALQYMTGESSRISYRLPDLTGQIYHKERKQ